MAPTMKQEYEMLRQLGMPESRAKIQAYIHSCRDSETETRENGVDYSQAHVRQSIVHTREDMWIVCYSIMDLQRQQAAVRRRLSVVVILLALIAFELARITSL